MLLLNQTLSSTVNTYAALMYSNDCANPRSHAATFMKTYQQRVNTGVSDMETCHLRNMESVLSDNMLLERNAAAELSLRAAFKRSDAPPLT